ncbi:MAG: B12-binding domain-containing protein [Candidatus Jordarchaeales archaeon]
MEREKVILERLKEAIVSLDIEGVKKACREAIDAGIPAYKCISEAMAKGLEVVGEKYERGEYFLAAWLLQAKP